MMGFLRHVSTGQENGRQITTDNDGNVYIVGGFIGTTSFSFTVPAYITAQFKDFYIEKFDRNGNFIWVKTLGSFGEDECNGIYIDAQKNIYLTGYFDNTVDFDPGPGVYAMSAGPYIYVPK